MVVLESCPKHNMVAYLEKTKGNAEFHQIINFLMRSSIHNALTVVAHGRHLVGNFRGYRSSQGNSTIKGKDQEAQEESQTYYHTPQSLDEECILEAKIDRQEILKEKLDAKRVFTVRPLYLPKGKDSTVRTDEGTVDQTEGRRATPTTQTTTPTIFRDDKTIAQVLLNMSQAKAVSRDKEKGVKLKDVEETERPRPTSTRSILTLKPLLKIDPKDKGKKKIEEEDESDTEYEGIPEAEKKFNQLARDEEMARKLQED
ncbi:hypothetical protein Tco_1428353 [Tanacetum coccineum]